MDYPNEYNTPAFPAGKTIAFSRAVSIWISVVFFLIICACCFIVLCTHFKSNFPFLISVDPFTDEWSVIAYPNKDEKNEVQQYQIVQEKLVNDFVTNWFTISNDAEINQERWQKCSFKKETQNNEDEPDAGASCFSPEQFKPDNIKCAIFCKSDKKLFEDFENKVLPEYKNRFIQGPEQWTVQKKDIRIDKISENGGQWQVYANIRSNINGLFKILAFVTIDRDTKNYPATLGYYVKDFNSYRMTQ